MRADHPLAVPVYAGGDDLLAFCPAAAALDLAAAIRRQVDVLDYGPLGSAGADGGPIMVSTAVVFTHMSSPLQAALAAARSALRLAKSATGGRGRSRDALAVRWPWSCVPAVVSVARQSSRGGRATRTTSTPSRSWAGSGRLRLLPSCPPLSSVGLERDQDALDELASDASTGASWSPSCAAWWSARVGARRRRTRCTCWASTSGARPALSVPCHPPSWPGSSPGRLDDRDLAGGETAGHDYGPGRASVRCRSHQHRPVRRPGAQHARRGRAGGGRPRCRPYHRAGRRHRRGERSSPRCRMWSATITRFAGSPSSRAAKRRPPTSTTGWSAHPPARRGRRPGR